MQGWHRGAKPPLGAASSSLKQKVKTHGCAIRMGKGGQTSIPPPPHCPATSCHLRALRPQAGGGRPQGQGGSLLGCAEWLRPSARVLHKRKNRRQVALPNLVIPSPPAPSLPFPAHAGGTGRGGAVLPRSHAEHPARPVSPVLVSQGSAGSASPWKSTELGTGHSAAAVVWVLRCQCWQQIKHMLRGKEGRCTAR